jgi:putative cardiolipin synthase
VIDAGVELYEVRANAGREVQNGEGPEVLTMHTKLILIDRRYLLVGSLNLDPRAIKLNSEFGLLIESEALTGAMASAIDDTITTFAYHVVKDDKGHLEWRGNVGGVEVAETSEPLASGWRRFKAWFMKIVPESQL